MISMSVAALVLAGLERGDVRLVEAPNVAYRRRRRCCRAMLTRLVQEALQRERVDREARFKGGRQHRLVGALTVA